MEEQPLEFWRNLIAAVEGKEECYIKQFQLLRQMKIVDAAFLSSEKDEVLKVEI